MFTSAGRSRRISESTAFGVGSMMSMRRLWVRISKCSRLSLYLCGERITVTTFFSVGSGTGPTTFAPARVTVSTILLADESMISWSYDFSRMRILLAAILTRFRLLCSYEHVIGRQEETFLTSVMLMHCFSVNARFLRHY